MDIHLLETGEVLRTFLRKDVSYLSVDEHIAAGMNWLLCAQDATGDDGVAIRFSLIRGWMKSYPETTGYIIPTFLDYYEMTGNSKFKDRALRMAEWELSIQQGDGSYRGGAIDQGLGSIVFDTGQIIFGLLSAFKAVGDERYMNAARRAGDWLLSVQDGDGAWRKHTYNSLPHTYHSRVAWPLVKLYKESGEKKYLIAARKNIDWVITNQRENGWFENAGFNPENNKSPYTHTIAYTIRGILEAGMLLDEQCYIEAARKSSDELLNIMHTDGFFWGRYDARWMGHQRFSCLTGNAQISIIFSILHELTGNRKYHIGAVTLNNYLRLKQIVVTEKENIRGAIAGSYPIWGEYERFAYPNWAAKFFIDALMLEKKSNDP